MEEGCSGRPWFGREYSVGNRRPGKGFWVVLAVFQSSTHDLKPRDHQGSAGMRAGQGAKELKKLPNTQSIRFRGCEPIAQVSDITIQSCMMCSIALCIHGYSMNQGPI